MTDAVTEVLALVPLEEDQVPKLAGALDRAQEACDDAEIPFQPDRLVLLGVHLAGAIKRFDAGELLDPFKESMFAQASDEAMDMATTILEPLTAAPLPREERFLVAVHIDTARHMARKGKK